MIKRESCYKIINAGARSYSKSVIFCLEFCDILVTFCLEILNTFVTKDLVIRLPL